MSHILIVGAGPAGLSAALRLASHGQRVTLAAAKPPIYNRCAGLPGVDLPEEDAQQLRALGAQNLSGHEVMQALSRCLLRCESDGHVRFLPYHRLLRLAVAEGCCVGGVLLNEHTDTLEGVSADAVLLATGGMHTMFMENRFGCDGLATALAFESGAALRSPDQLPVEGRFPICAGGLVTGWDGETTLPGLYAAGECAHGTAVAFPFAQAMTTGAAAADALSESLPEADPIEAEYAVVSAVTAVQQLLDVFRRTQGARATAAVERRIRETIQRTLAGERTAKLLQRGLLDIKVMRQQAGRGGYDLGEGLYPALRLPSLLQLLEVMLTTAAFRLLRQDGELTAEMRAGKIEVTAKRSPAAEAVAQDFGVAPENLISRETGASGVEGEETPPEPSLKDDLWRANAPARPAPLSAPVAPAASDVPSEPVIPLEPAAPPEPVVPLEPTAPPEPVVSLESAAPLEAAASSETDAPAPLEQTLPLEPSMPFGMPAASTAPLSPPDSPAEPTAPPAPPEPEEMEQLRLFDIDPITVKPKVSDEEVDAAIAYVAQLTGTPPPARLAKPAPAAPVYDELALRSELSADLAEVPASRQIPFSPAQAAPEPGSVTEAAPAPESQEIPFPEPAASQDSPVSPQDRIADPGPAFPLEAPASPEPAESAEEPAAQVPSMEPVSEPYKNAREHAFMPDPEELLAMSPPAPKIAPPPEPKPAPELKAPRPEPSPRRAMTNGMADFTSIPDPEDLLNL